MAFDLDPNCLQRLLEGAKQASKLCKYSNTSTVIVC